MMMLLLGSMKFFPALKKSRVIVSCMVLYPLNRHPKGTKTANGISVIRYKQIIIPFPDRNASFLRCTLSLVGVLYTQEWPHASYPPWAHGPGYIISRDIAKFIVHGHQERDLKVKYTCLKLHSKILRACLTEIINGGLFTISCHYIWFFSFLN